MDIQDYPSRMGDPGSKRFEAFSYLVPMDEATVTKQIDHVARKGWDCVVEHVEPDRIGDGYWYMWKLPLFGERDPNVVLAEAEACRKANPGHHVRISAIDKVKQTIGFSLVVHRGGCA